MLNHMKLPGHAHSSMWVEDPNLMVGSNWKSVMEFDWRITGPIVSQ